MQYIKHFVSTILVVSYSVSGCKKVTDSSTVPHDNLKIGNLQVFPKDNPWNTDISKIETDPNSNNIIAGIGNTVHLHPDFGTVWDDAPIGIPYNLIGKNQPMKSVSFQYKSESDPGPYPIPPDALVESGSDRHVLVIDTINLKLYELFSATRNSDNTWNAGLYI